MSKLTAACNVINALQPAMRINLPANHLVVVTYASNLRICERKADEHTLLNEIPETVLIEPVKGGRLELTLWHGRATADVDMEGQWGYEANSTEGYSGKLTGDLFIMTKDGVTAVDLGEDGGCVESLVPFSGDVLHYEHHFYGDFSIGNVEAEVEEEVTKSLRSILGAPDAVRVAFRAVQNVFADLLTVSYDAEMRWLYQLKDGSAPNFADTGIDVSILEAAADALTQTEVTYYQGLIPKREITQTLWDLLAATTVTEDGALDQVFLHFASGTPREEIWHWFEAQNMHFSAAKGGFIS